MVVAEGGVCFQHHHCRDSYQSPWVGVPVVEDGDDYCGIGGNSEHYSYSLYNTEFNAVQAL